MYSSTGQVRTVDSERLVAYVTGIARAFGHHALCIVSESTDAPSTLARPPILAQTTRFSHATSAYGLHVSLFPLTPPSENYNSPQRSAQRVMLQCTHIFTISGLTLRVGNVLLRTCDMYIYHSFASALRDTRGWEAPYDCVERVRLLVIPYKLRPTSSLTSLSGALSGSSRDMTT